MPLCDAEGMFVPLQCFEHETYGKQCWCVDSTGQEIKGTRLDNGTAPECGECLQFFFVANTEQLWENSGTILYDHVLFDIFFLFSLRERR